MAQNFLTSSRHGTVFYYRRRVPDDLRQVLGKPYLVRTLATTHRAAAIVLARQYAARTDALYGKLRAMKKAGLEPLQYDLTTYLDLGDFGKLVIESQPHETADVQAIIKTTLQNLPNQSGALQKSDPVQAQISASDLLEDFFRDGFGSGRWKTTEATVRRDYGPIWKKFTPHIEKYGLTLAAAKSYRAAILDENVAQETKNRNLYRIHAVVAFGKEHHDLDEKMLKELKMPKHKGRGKNSRAKSYLPFTDDELRLLFHSDAYRTNTFKKASHYWLPLLGLYTGARLEELAGLHLSVFNTVDDIPAVVLSDEEESDGGKNEHAPRQVPIHPELVKAGLLEYVKQLKSEGHTRLFPEIRAAARDGYGKRPSTDFTAYRRTVGVGKDEGERSRKVFHSFRATLAGKFYHLGMDGDLSRRLTGHAPIDVHQGTYLGAAAIPMQRADGAMRQVTFGLEHTPFSDTPAYVKSRKRKQYGS